MGELGGEVTYLYWSQRRTEKFLNDNGIERTPVTRTIASPAFSVAPVFSRSSTRQGGLRPQVANLIESTLGQSAVTCFNSPQPIRYAKGLGSMVFGEFIANEALGGNQPATGSPAVIFSSADDATEDEGPVAICLFGSMDNFADRIQVAGPGFDSGWTSSSAPQVFDFLRSQCRQECGYLSPEGLAVEALRIAVKQGQCGGNGRPEPAGFDRPWLRAFTYGDVQDTAEWLAQIYLDVDFAESGRNHLLGRHWNFRRVLIGAPFWIRTAKPQALRLYGEMPPESRRPPIVSGWRRFIVSSRRVDNGEMIPCDE